MVLPFLLNSQDRGLAFLLNRWFQAKWTSITVNFLTKRRNITEDTVECNAKNHTIKHCNTLMFVIFKRTQNDPLMRVSIVFNFEEPVVTAILSPI